MAAKLTDAHMAEATRRGKLAAENGEPAFDQGGVHGAVIKRGQLGWYDTEMLYDAYRRAYDNAADLAEQDRQVEAPEEADTAEESRQDCYKFWSAKGAEIRASLDAAILGYVCRWCLAGAEVPCREMGHPVSYMHAARVRDYLATAPEGAEAREEAGHDEVRTCDNCGDEVTHLSSRYFCDGCEEFEAAVASRHPELLEKAHAPEKSDEDERIQAWHQIAEHPFFAECYPLDEPLIVSMIAKLDKVHEYLSALDAPQPAIQADFWDDRTTPHLTEGGAL